MSLTIRPQTGVDIDKILGIDVDSDELKTFIITNNGTKEVYLEYPDPSTLQGVEIVNNGEARSPAISPGGGEHRLTIRVHKEYINSFDDTGVFNQVLKIKAIGYEPPPTGTPWDYYTLEVSPRNPIVVDQYTYIFDTYVTMFGHDGVETKRIVPDNGYTIDPETDLDRQHLSPLAFEPTDDGRTRIRFRIFDPTALESTWIISPRGSEYIDAAGNPLEKEIQIYVEQDQDTVSPPRNPGDTPEEPIDTSDSGGSPGTAGPGEEGGIERPSDRVFQE